MPKQKKGPKLYACTAAGDGWKCDQRFPAGSGGTIGAVPRCPGHYQQARRDPGAELRPLVDRSEPLVLVKFYVTRQGREQLAQRARAAGVSVSAYCAGLVLA